MKSLARVLVVLAITFAAGWVAHAQPANDLFANAWTLSGLSVSTNGNSANAAPRETGEPNHAGNPGGRSVWFNWLAPRDGQIRLDTIGSAINTMLAVYTGNAVNALTPIASNDDAPGLGSASRVEFLALQGVTYRIVVDVFNQVPQFPQFRPQGGEYVLNLQALASVKIISPTNGEIAYVGHPFDFEVEAEVGNPPIGRVEFYRGASLLGSDTTSPYSLSVSNSPLGTNLLSAVAVDGGGIRWTSAVVRVVVLNLGVTIVSPLDGAIFQNTNPVGVSVVASLPSGTITNVEFFADEQKFGQDATAPFAAPWNSVLGGVHRLTAIGRDNGGIRYTSTPVTVSFPRVLVPLGSVWKYLDNGSDQGTNWTTRNFDDSAWASGPAELGYSSNPAENDEATVISFGGDPDLKPITTYFRRALFLNNAANYTNVTVNIKRDDGAVLYLNGVEVQRFNMPFGTVNYLTAASTAADDGASFYSANVPRSLLVEGLNLLAVEVHQDSPTSDDLSFNLSLQGVLFPRNDPPLITLISPTNRESFLAPSSITLIASASDPDGAVAKVRFYADGALLGETTGPAHRFTWNNPPAGRHVLRALAIDDSDTSIGSEEIEIFVYDAAGTPLAQISSPADGTVIQGPISLPVEAHAGALDGVASVEFLANGALFSTFNVQSSPINVQASALWPAPFGTNTLLAVTIDAGGRRGTSAPVTVTVTIPPTNTVAPTITARNPAANATVTTLSTIRITFSERVTGVDAADLLVNSVPATALTVTPGSGATPDIYLFTVGQPATEGTIHITWAAGHGITDFGYPSSLPFNENAPGGSWTYTFADRTPPTILTRNPAAGAVLTNLSQIAVTFSEAVSGVDAADFLVNGAPAFGLSGGGAAYTFSFSQPPSGPVNITWAAGHGIRDLAVTPNNFLTTGTNGSWSYTLDARTVLSQSNATWRFVKGLAEASAPANAWRAPAFDDANWSNAPAPFFFNDPYGSAANPGTQLTDMQGNYNSLFLRRQFTVQNAGPITNLFLNAQSDDGFVAWINGVEVARSANVPAGEVPYNATLTAAANEPGGAGAAYVAYTLANPAAYLVDGPNTLAIQAFNQNLNSGDFGFNAQLYTFLADPATVAPRITGVSPGAGSLFFFTNLVVRFSEAVTAVDAADLLINGVPATSVNGASSNLTYVFTFAQPPFGPVSVTWAAGHAIVDFDAPPKPFDGAAAGATFQYTLLNPSTPTIVGQTPPAGATVDNFTQLTVTFSESVTGVNAADLLINGQPATGLSGTGANYTFTFARPEFGPVTISWVAGHGIADLDVPPVPFDVTRQGSSWSYTHVDQTAPRIAALSPPAGAQVTNLTQITVTFSEAVTGVNASDLRVNGVPATGLTGGPLAYQFTFPQPNATVVNLTWAPTHGIRDLATVPNPFDSTGPGAIWSYATPDNVAPTVANTDPAPFVTLPSLNSIRVTFTEVVTGVDTNDLLINDRPALSVTGSGAGPYSFNFLPPSNGVVRVSWIAGHGIADLATPTPNPFGGGEWTYTLEPNASFAGKVVVNEILFNSVSGLPADEWIELLNVSTAPVNLAGWRFTRGVRFTFPNVSLPPNGYLVVAADLAAFQAKFPEVSTVVGGWSGSLANSDETIELETAQGEIVNSVHYATEGDWARRERGHGASLVETLTRNGTTATARIFGHGYTAGGNGTDQILISGADQPEYNGLFTLTGAASSTFNYTVTGTPASPATGRIIARQAVDNGASGWSWFAPADGFGNSLELVNAALGNASGQNWLPSATLGGTPGAPNSTASANVAPLILEPAHFPPVPRSTDLVTITARVRDELTSGVASVRLFYRDHTSTTPGPFASTNLLDDGAHGDGLNRDGLYGAVLPAMPNGTVIEFYVQATDTSGLSRTWPAPTWDTDNTFAQLANALYQVDDEVISDFMPALRVVLTGSEYAAFPWANRNSDAEVNATFLSIDGDGTKIRYLSGVRIRGAGSRNQTIPNNRVNIPNDNRWNGLQAINLNSLYVHSQIMGAAVSQRAGLPASQGRLIQYRRNGVNPSRIEAPGGGGRGDGYGTFIMVEPVNGDLAARLFPNDGEGNVYRASTGNHSAQLINRGTNADAYVTDGYFKTSNGTENDWTDMASLTFAFSQQNVPLADYVQTMSTNVNVEMWMRYFAVGTLVCFGETSMFNGRGDDYALYRGVNDPRFVAIGHDFDTIFGQGDTTGSFTTTTNNTGTPTIFIMLNPPNSGGFNAPNMQLLRRFLTNGVYAPILFGEIKRLTDTVFHPSQMGPLMDQMLTWPNGPTTVTIDQMKTFAANRRSVVLSLIPMSLTVNHTLSSASGFPMTTTPNVMLFGTFNAIDTRKVLVNGALASTSPWEGRWTNSVTLQPGINRVLVQTLNSNDVEFARATVEIWYDDGAAEPVSGALTADTVWSSATGPYQVTASLTVPSGVTLTILPGTTVYLSPGANLTVASGGRILAEGTDTARIRFSPAPGAGNWGGIVINGGTGSPESRFAYAHFAGYNNTAIDVNAGDLFLSHCTFLNTAERHLDLDGASFVVEDCWFPSSTAAFEPIHGTIGIKAGGRGIIRRNFLGKTMGYNDSIDFTGGNRPGPILQILNNVFLGSDDDLLDLDSTDAWIEGNIFLHTHRNGSPDSASAVSGGADNADTSQITIVGNLFFDVDHAANAKQGNFYTMLNNTIVHQTKIGSEDTNTAVVILADMNEQGTFTAQGAGMYLEGNLILDAENLTRHVTTALVTYTNNLIHQLTGAPWTGPGGGNVNADPLLTRIPPFSETTNFNSWAAAQVMWDYFTPRTGSPAAAAGPNGRDVGAVNVQRSFGVTIGGEPLGATPLNTATLRVDPLRTGNGIPTAGFADGSGFTHYRWRLDSGAWSAESPTATPISLSALSTGPHFVEVVGKNDAGFYQDDPIFGEDAIITVSRTWTVDPTSSTLRLNEILASNGGAVNHHGTTPDVIELYNASDAVLNLAGMRLTDDINNPDKFIFPAGASIAARGYLTVFANNSDGTPGYHLGFNLSQQGDSVYLFAAASSGGRLLDSVSFGPQLTDFSIARSAIGDWQLAIPTPGAANRASQLGDPRALRLNEWLAVGDAPFNSDFIELYNTDPLPVALAGLYLTDEILGWPDRHEMAALSFIAGNGYLRLIADGSGSSASQSGAGADHLNFSLNGDQGAIALNAADLSLIDSILYPGQRPNVSQGRSPNGASAIVFFDTPTPGAPNPTVTGPPPFGGALVINEVLAANTSLAEVIGTNVVTPDWVELYNGTTGEIDLANLSLSDDSLLPRKFIFAAGTRIAAGGYLRVHCADGQPASANNTGFGLKSAGGAVYLFNSPANGGSLVNSIIYGIQTPNLSIGRVPSGGADWALNTPTPNASNNAVPTLGIVANLKVNEWLANPASGGNDWFEIYNPNPLPVALGGLHLTDDLNNRTKHRIAALSFLGTATNAYLRIHADNNTGAGADHVGFSLRADGEAVGISTTDGSLINGHTFIAQQEGISEGSFPDGDTNIVAFPGTVSPGESNWRQLADIAINEVLTHTDLPLEDAIELRNLTAAPIDVGGWWLSDDEGALQKYRLPVPTVIPPFGFAVIYENVLTNAEIAPIPFALSSKGDEVVLSAYANNALTGYRTRVDFGAAANGVSFGRYMTSDGRAQFVAMSARTFGADDPGDIEEFRTGTGLPNAYPRVGPVAISEVMYHPPDLGVDDNARDEFIELRNITTAPVPLFDPNHPTNGWRLRDAVDFDFPPDTMLQPGDTLLVVGFDPVNNPVALAAFRATYNLAASVPILGPWSGKLANDTDDIELRRPDAPNLDGDVPYYLVERVRYSDTAPWPAEADGTGYSLQRLADDQFANDPANWIAAAPTPGPAPSSGDTDGDGLPDDWETLHSLDPFNPNDAALDSDGDGLTNLQEFQLGADPRNPASGLRLTIARAPGGAGLVLSFAAAANVGYAIDTTDELGAGWQPLQNFAAVSTNRVVQLAVAASGTKRFYRLRTETGVAPVALRINAIESMPGGQLRLNFNAPANQSCTLLFTPNLGGIAWGTVTNYPAVPNNRVIQLEVPASGTPGFYRLRSP
jgi:hypothetical protein